MPTGARSISCVVTLSQKCDVVAWTNPSTDMGRMRSHIERDVTVVISARRANSGSTGRVRRSASRPSLRAVDDHSSLAILLRESAYKQFFYSENSK